jgi:hypothetical protein
MMRGKESSWNVADVVTDVFARGKGGTEQGI